MPNRISRPSLHVITSRVLRLAEDRGSQDAARISPTFQSPRAFQWTSRGPMVTRGRRISLPFQAPRPILQEGFAPLGGSSTHSRTFPRCSHTPGGRHFTPETSSGGVQVATTLWRCHRSGCLTSLPGRECSAHTQNRGHDGSMACVYETNMPKRLRLEILSLG